MKTQGQGWLVWVIGAVAVVVAAVLGYFALRDAPVDGDAAVQTAESADVAPKAEVEAEAETPDDAAEVETAEAKVPEAEAAPENETEVAESLSVAPAFDVVRAAPDGSVVVAGLAPADAQVDVLVDGEIVSAVTADSAGSFVAVFDLPVENRPRLMQLSVDGPDGPVLSDDTFIIEAMTPPEPVEPPVEMSEPPVEVAEATSEAVAEAPSDEVEEGTEDGAATSATVETTATVEAPAAPTVPTAPRVLKADEDGIEVVADATPPEGLTLDTITYDDAGGVQIAGRGAAGDKLRLYLDNEAQSLVDVGVDGRWSTTLAGVVPGIYDLRIDALDAAGEVIARVASPFKREDPAVLAELAATGDGTSGQVEPVEVNTEVSQVGDPATPDTPLSETVPQTGESAPDMAEAAEDAVGATATELAQAPDTAGPQSDLTQPAATEAPAAGTAPTVRVVTVQPGSTLWAIASERYGDGVRYVQVFEANRDKIKDPDLIYPGQVFNLPDN